MHGRPACHRGALLPETAFSMPRVSTARIISIPSWIAMSISSLSFRPNPCTRIPKNKKRSVVFFAVSHLRLACLRARPNLQSTCIGSQQTALAAALKKIPCNTAEGNNFWKFKRMRLRPHLEHICDNLHAPRRPPNACTDNNLLQTDKSIHTKKWNLFLEVPLISYRANHFRAASSGKNNLHTRCAVKSNRAQKNL